MNTVQFLLLVLCMNKRQFPGFALLTALLCSGCVPDVAWLPDSSGIVYTTSAWPLNFFDKNKEQEFTRLHHYDLQTKTTREIAKANSNTYKLAMRLPSREVALVEFQRQGDQSTIQIILVDLQGKIIHRSAVFPWVKLVPNNESPEACFELYWSPDGQKLIVCGQELALYDVKRNKLQRLGLLGTMNFGTTPVIPNGQGFLAADSQRSLFVVDWEGNKSAIEVDPQLLVGRPGQYLYSADAYCWSRWEGNIAVSLWRGRKASIDPIKKKAIVEEVDKSVWSFQGKEVLQHYQFPDTKVTLVVLFDKSIRDFNDAGVQTCHVELHTPDGKARKIVPLTAHCGIFPAPNQQVAALRYMDENSEHILFINKHGETLDELSTVKK